MRRPGRQRGFTLLEMLIAVALLGVGIVSLLGLHARNIRLASETQEITRAGLLASRVMAGARLEPRLEIGTTEGTFTADADAAVLADVLYGGADSESFAWTREVLPTMLPSLKQVRVSVRRNDDHEDASALAVLNAATREKLR